MSDNLFAQVSAMILPPAFRRYFLNRLREISALYQSGIVQRDTAMDALVGNGGQLIDLPFFNDLTDEDQVLDDNTDLNVGAITTGQDKARLLARAGVFGATDLSAALSGEDPLAAIADLMANWWVRREQRILMSVLKGVFASNAVNNRGDLVLDVSDLSGNAGCLTLENILQAAQLLGDAKGVFTAMTMHSACETVLNMQYGGTTFTPSEKPGILYDFNGKSVIMDDLMDYDPSTKKATIYLFGQGAVAAGEGNVPVPFETGREALKAGGRSYLVQRRAFIMHLRGVKWREAVCEKQHPTNAELENHLNWLRVYEKKAIRVVKLVVRAEKAAPEAIYVRSET
jgi:hypothetical protein